MSVRLLLVCRSSWLSRSVGVDHPAVRAYVHTYAYVRMRTDTYLLVRKLCMYVCMYVLCILLSAILPSNRGQQVFFRVLAPSRVTSLLSRKGINQTFVS